MLNQRSLVHVFSTSVFFFSVGTLGLLPHYSVYKETHTLTTQGLDAHSHDLRLHHFAFCSLFFWTWKMSALWRWDGDMGWAKRTGRFFEGCRPRCASGLIMNSQWCQMFYEQSTTFNLFLCVFFSCLFVHLFSIYLKQKYMDRIEHGRANQCYSGRKSQAFILQQYICLLSGSVLSLSVFLNK